MIMTPIGARKTMKFRDRYIAVQLNRKRNQRRLTLQYTQLKKPVVERDTISQMSQESSDSREPPLWIAAGEIRRRLSDSFHEGKNRTFTHDPEDPSAAALKEPWLVSS